VPLLFLVSALSFLLLSLVPGDPALTILGNQATPEKVAALHHRLGLDLPLPERYWHWLSHAVRGDLGQSLYTGESVRAQIGQRLPVSLSLIVGGLILIPGIGVALGMFSAVRGGIVGRFVDGLSLVGAALPPIVVGAVLVDLLAVKTHIFPAVGYVPLKESPTQWLRSLALPVTALSIGGIASFAKNTREATLDVLASEYMRMAWARGIPPRRIFFVYGLKNVGTRVLTLTGLLTIGLLGGTVLVESIFALPGLGLLVSTGASQRDVPVVEGVAVFFTLIIVVVNIVTDLAYSLLDPRVKTS
jgi:peptide/nickel transport system permease protein